VGDDDGGSAGAQVGEGGLDGGFAFGVQRAGSFVEQQHAGVAQQGAGEGDALALAAGESAALLADEGFEAEGEFVDEVRGGGGFGGGPDCCVGGAGAAHADVGGDGVVEQQAILADIGEGVAQGGEGDIAQVRAVEADGAGGDVLQAGDEGEGGGFAGAGGADEGDGLAGEGFETEIAEAETSVRIDE